MKVLACYSIKGGVGKTATSVNMAYCAAKFGLRVLLCDLDPQGASSFYFRVRLAKKARLSAVFSRKRKLLQNVKGSDYENLDILPAHLSYRNFDIMLKSLSRSKRKLDDLLRRLTDEYDLIVLDCPPNITLLAENIFKASDVVLVPVIPTTLSERTLGQLHSFYKSKGLPRKQIRPFFSLVEYKKKLHGETMRRIRKGYPRILDTEIPYCSDVENMGRRRKPVMTFAGSSRGGKAYRKLWEETERKLNLK